MIARVAGAVAAVLAAGTVAAVPAQAAGTATLTASPALVLLNVGSITKVTLTARLPSGSPDTVPGLSRMISGTGKALPPMTHTADLVWTEVYTLPKGAKPTTLFFSIVWTKPDLTAGTTGLTVDVDYRSRLSFKASATTVTRGHRVTLSGRTTVQNGAGAFVAQTQEPVWIYYRRAGTHTWVSKGLVNPNSKGSFAKSFVVPAAGSWQARFPGWNSATPVNSAEIYIHVR